MQLRHEFLDPIFAAQRDMTSCSRSWSAYSNCTSAVLRLPQETESLYLEIESTDRSIAKLVYELYELAEEEIRVLES